MGGKNSGRRSLKFFCIEKMMDIQTTLLRLKYQDVQGEKTRDDLEKSIDECLQITRSAQEEIERYNV